MFIRKDEYLELTKKIADVERTNNILSNSIAKLEKEKQSIKQDLENEHIENYEQHKKLLQIERLLNNPFGSYKNLLQFRNKVKEILKNELSVDCSRR